MVKRDPTLDGLLDLDGQVLVVDPQGQYWVRFVVRRVKANEARPHGIDYSLTLHGPTGERLAGFDTRIRLESARVWAEKPAPRLITGID